MATKITDSMLPQVEANGVMYLPMDLFDIDRRIKDGDESGWRGDPSMGLFYNPHAGRFEVWGRDRANNEYLAATHHELSVEIVHKLRDSDPQRVDVFQQVLDHNEKVKADNAAKDREKLAEVADKLKWGIRQDFGHLAGGTRRLWHLRRGAHSTLPDKEGDS